MYNINTKIMEEMEKWKWWQLGTILIYVHTILKVYINHVGRCGHLNVFELLYIIKSREQMYLSENLIFTQWQLIIPEEPAYSSEKNTI